MSSNEKKLREFFLEKGIEILYDFSKNRKFNNGDIIFRDKNNYIYTVDILLKNIEDIIKFIEINFDVSLKKYENAIKILKLLILFLNNKQYQKPRNEDVIECIKTLMELENRSAEEVNSIVLFIKMLNGVWVNE